MFTFVEGAVGVKMAGRLGFGALRMRKLQFVRAFGDNFNMVAVRDAGRMVRVVGRGGD